MTEIQCEAKNEEVRRRLRVILRDGSSMIWYGGGCTGLKLCLSSTRGEFAAALRPDSTTVKFFA